MGFDASVLARRRVLAFVVVGAAVGTWFVVAPHLSPLALWPAVILVSVAVLPATLLALCLVLAAIETLLVKMRILLIPRLLAVASAVALCGVVATVTAR